MPTTFRTAALLVALVALAPGIDAQAAGAAADLERRWGEANGRCRGGSGDDPATDKACEARDALGRRLEALGRCYGRQGEAGYQKRWHRCGPTSSRAS